MLQRMMAIFIVVFTHIIEIAGQNSVLCVPHKNIIFCFRKLHHTFRHTPDNQILTVKLHGCIVQGRGHVFTNIKTPALTGA